MSDFPTGKASVQLLFTGKLIPEFMLTGIPARTAGHTPHAMRGLKNKGIDTMRFSGAPSLGLARVAGMTRTAGALIGRRTLIIGAMASAFTAVHTEQAMAVSDVDVAALAALRPGMPLSSVEAAMGSSWRAPPPHKGGRIDLLENSHGFVARIDRAGLIGSLDFDHRFRHRVGDLANGMLLQQVSDAMPDLEIGGDQPTMPGVRIGVKRFADGYTLRVRITLEAVNDIAYFNPTADYSEPTEPPYPIAAGVLGAPFGDPNLKLVVLSSLLDAKVVDLGTPQQFVTHVLGRPVDLEEAGYDLIPEAMDYLTRYPMTDELLAAVEAIEFDGGGTAYRFAWYFWDGEDDVFEVRKLSGLGQCVNLKSFSATSMIGTVDVRELVSFGKLESVSLAVEFENIEAMLNMPSLKYVSVINDLLFREVTTLGTPTRQLFDTLKARGVRISVHWATTSDPSLPAFE